MKLYMKHWDSSGCEECGVALGVNWYRHHRGHPYNGYTFGLHFFEHRLDFTLVTHSEDKYELRFPKIEHGHGLTIGPRRKK